ncbi:serpin family protein [Nocardia lijiangensis]|uniref:serpin family protein n=1 Tax=Nocardia lijiangensis TaxID=299618 RepID=UPI000836E45A|nr:serpin family protein [Nocardia lijiangensis]
MGSTVDTHVAAVNELTARWAAAAGADDFVVSGAGLWPLLGLLAGAAEGPARDELEAAIGVPAKSAHGAALELMRIMAESEDLSAVLGAWFAETLPLRREWTDTVPPDTIGRLTGQDALDAWAARGTGGLIERFPLRIAPDIRMVLATALVARTRWRDPFDDTVLRPESGPWRGLRGRGLVRSTGDLTAAALLDGPDPVTRVVVTGTADLDVHLLLGSSMPGSVLATGLAALTGRTPVRSALPPGTTGPGLRVSQHHAPRPGDRLDIRMPPFEIRSSHNLCATPELFGLTAAMTTDRGHFPAVSPQELAIAQGAQDVLARFTAEGFEAAAVTAVSARAVSMPLRADHLVTQVDVVFDRPFGFLAVHRETGLAVVAGWVARLPIRRDDEQDPLFV